MYKIFSCGIARVGSVESGNSYVEYFKLLEEAKDNKKGILDTAEAIEHFVTSIISHYFFPKDSDLKNEFDIMILRSDSCTFSAKRKLVKWVVQSEGLLEEKAAQEFDRLLGKTMSYRNRFVHGSMVCEPPIVKIHYFEGTPKECILNDGELKKIERDLLDAYNTARNLELIWVNNGIYINPLMMHEMGLHGENDSNTSPPPVRRIGIIEDN